MAEGSLIEWWEASDCWTLYRVTGAPSAPASGSSRWEFPIERLAHAGIGHKSTSDCAGDVSSAVIRVDVNAPGVVRASDIALPVLYGPYLMAPHYWRDLGSRYSVEYEAPTRQATFFTRDLAEAKRLTSYWRDPDLPAGWTFALAGSCLPDYPEDGYCAEYRNERGYIGASLCIAYLTPRPWFLRELGGGDGSVRTEARLIDGYVAFMEYSPPGHLHDDVFPGVVLIFDSATGIQYLVIGSDPSMRKNIDAVVAFARSLMPD